MILHSSEDENEHENEDEYSLLLSKEKKISYS
jgi:hypothetical protein